MSTAKWQSYPRPQLKRESYVNLNGDWSLNKKAIEIPFAPQSRLSGYEGEVGEQLVYETTFTIPDSFDKERIILHFGAVDQIASVYVNDVLVGKHEGGYLHFSFDITEQVKREGDNQLKVEAIDTHENLLKNIRLYRIYSYYSWWIH